MTVDIWNLDLVPCDNKAETYCKTHGYDKGTHHLYSVGQVISFMTGEHNHLLAKASIKGIDGNDLYVYNDCYWFPIKADDPNRDIKILA